LSYVITADAEIVRVIEGKDKKKGSAEIEKPLSLTHSQIENDKIAGASMKSLSFNECAKVVVGNRRNDDEEEYEYDDEDMEEIIDGTPKLSKDNDLEKGLSQIEVVI
jgi:hypothetical protein